MIIDGYFVVELSVFFSKESKKGGINEIFKIAYGDSCFNSLQL